MDWGLLVYRIVLGLTGSVSIICLFHLLRNVPRWVQLVGTSTEAIYILQACILEHLIGGFIMQKTDWFLSIQQLPSFVLMGIVLPIIAIMLVLLCMWLYQLTRYLPIVARIRFTLHVVVSVDTISTDSGSYTFRRSSGENLGKNTRKLAYVGKK